MNIRKKLALAAAVALPVSGLVVLGGVQVASAGGPPVLSCATLGSDSGSTGGVTFDNNGSGPGTAGLSLGAGFSASAVTGVLDELALPTGTAGIPQVVELAGEAIGGQTLLLSNGQTVTVISDNTAHTGVGSAKNLETAIITPNLGAPIGKKVALQINPTTVTSYQTYNNTTVSSSSAVVTATTADFTGDVGMPVSVTYNDVGDGGYFSPFNPPSAPASPVVVASFISAVNGAGTQATISQYEKPAPGSSAEVTETINSTVSAAAVVTVGQSDTTTNNTTETDYDLALTGCQSSLHADAGVIFPNNVTLTTPPGTGTPGANSALALESSVLPINGASINFPSGLPAGYSWGDAGENTASVSFNSAKDALNLTSDTESFVGGVVPVGDPYSTSKASMSFGLGSVVACTVAQLQAIGTGSGGSGIDHSSIPAAANAGQVGVQALKYCDGGSLSAVDGGGAFGELAVIEADPNAGGGGSDGTGLGAIWQAGGTGTAVF